ncbi:MAG: ATP-binding protein [Acidobacteriota bacterium]
MEAAPARNTARERYEPLFVGRGEELAQLWELATKGRHVIVTGSPGAGKSALLSVFYRALQSRDSLYIFRVGDSRQFKTALVDLAEQMHVRGIFRHPTLPPATSALPWEKLAPKVRALTARALAESLVLGLEGRNAIVIWDQFERATPTELSWLHQFLNVATLVVGTSDPSHSKLKVLLDRIPARIELKELSEAESYELIEQCFGVAPFGVCDPVWYRQEIWRKTAGHPRAIKDLLADHSLEKYVDSRMIRAMASEQGVRYFAISPIVYLFALGFSIYRYVGRGLGERDSYIIGAAGMVIFIFLGMLVRKANRVSP